MFHMIWYEDYNDVFNGESSSDYSVDGDIQDDDSVSSCLDLEGTDFEFDSDNDTYCSSDVETDIEALKSPLVDTLEIEPYKSFVSEECLIPFTKPRPHYTLPLVSLAEAREKYIGSEIPEMEWAVLTHLITERDGEGILDWFKQKKVSRTAQKIVEKFSNSPLAVAARTGSMTIFNFLLGEGFCFNLNFDPLHDAVTFGYLHIVERLLEIGIDAEAKIAVNGRCPLHIASSQEDNMSKMIQLLLKHGACVNRVDGQGRTPLHLAVLHGSVENVITLLRAGADMTCVDNVGRPVLHMAVYRNLRMLKLVYAAGARPVELPQFDELRAAARGSKIHLLTYLIRRNIPLKVLKVKPRDTALYHAATSLSEPEDRDYMVNLLLGAGHPLSEGLVDAIESSMDDVIECPGDRAFREMLNCVLTNPRSLQDLSVIRLRGILGLSLPSAIKSLPLPNVLKYFVQLKHIVPK